MNELIETINLNDIEAVKKLILAGINLNLKKIVINIIKLKLCQIECTATKIKVMKYVESIDLDYLQCNKPDCTVLIDLYLQKIENILKPQREEEEMKRQKKQREIAHQNLLKKRDRLLYKKNRAKNWDQEEKYVELLEELDVELLEEFGFNYRIKNFL
jgi:hypothetical protein